MSQRKQNLNILFYSRVYGGMVTMKRVWGFAFFWFAVGMIVDFLLEGFWNFVVVVLALVIAYVLFCRC